MRLLCLLLAAVSASAAEMDINAPGFWSKTYSIPRAYCERRIALDSPSVENLVKSAAPCKFSIQNGGVRSDCRVTRKESDRIVGKLRRLGTLTAYEQNCNSPADYPELYYKRDNLRREREETPFTGAPAITVEAAECRPIWADLGKSWRICEQYLKPYPLCRWAQPPIEAIRALRAGHPFVAAQVRRVEVETFAQAARLDERRPTGTDAAQYSLPFALAAYLVRDRVTADEIAGASLSDATILALADRIELVSDPELSARYPAERVARVTVHLHDGSELRTGVAHARGTPEDPLSDKEIEEKFEASVAWLGPKRAAALHRAAFGLGKGAGSVEALLDAVLAPVSIPR